MGLNLSFGLWFLQSVRRPFHSNTVRIYKSALNPSFGTLAGVNCPDSFKMPTQLRHDLHVVDKESFPYIYETNATIALRSSDGHVRSNVFRPKSSDQGQRVPVLVTYGPYGKDAPYKE
jgi:hypothetical protein